MSNMINMADTSGNSERLQDKRNTTCRDRKTNCHRDRYFIHFLIFFILKRGYIYNERNIQGGR